MIIVFLLVELSLYAQKNENTNKQIMFRNFVYSCLDSLHFKTPKKHTLVSGISLRTDLEGNLICYSLGFSATKAKLSKREYKWLFKLLNSENYKKYEQIFNSDEDLEYYRNKGYLDYGIAYKSPEKRKG